MLSEMSSKYNVEKISNILNYIRFGAKQYITHEIDLGADQAKISMEEAYPPCNDLRLVTKQFSFDDILGWIDGIDSPKECYLRFRACWDDKEEFKE